jgi:hypothetical protein
VNDERRGPSVVIGDLTLTPIVRSEVRAHPLGKGVVAQGAQRVVAVIVQRGPRAWRLELPASDGAEPAGSGAA